MYKSQQTQDSYPWIEQSKNPLYTTSETTYLATGSTMMSAESNSKSSCAHLAHCHSVILDPHWSLKTNFNITSKGQYIISKQQFLLLGAIVNCIFGVQWYFTNELTLRLEIQLSTKGHFCKGSSRCKGETPS